MDKANTVGTLVKAGAILDAVELGPQDLSDLVAMTGQPRATCHRLAGALVDLGLLMRTDSGDYAIGPRVGELHAAADGDRLRTVAVPSLRRLREATGESAQIYRRRGDQRLCVASVEPTIGLRDTVPEGALLTMTAGSAAQVLCAWSDIPNTFDPRTLKKVRERGWAHSIGQRESGVASISAPVLVGGKAVAAVSVSGPIVRLDARRAATVATDVVAAAEAVSRELSPSVR